MKRIATVALTGLVLLFSAFGLSSCGSQQTPEPSDTKEYTAQLYFVNEAYVIVGDESLERLMPPEEVTITAKPATIEKEVVEALKTVPDKDGYGTMITAEMVINEVYIKDGTAYVDFARENLNGSSTQEGLLISQIVKTLRESFPEVEQVQFLVDGGIAESLMGHMAADKPFTE